MPSRHKYNMSHYWMTSFAMGYIVPFLCQEVVPGDSWNGRVSSFVRTGPLARPLFSVLNLHMHIFFVPHRIVWDGWEDFITGVAEADTVPTVTVQRNNEDVTFRNSDLGSYFGCHGAVSQLPFRAYNAVFNEFFRDQQLRPERAVTATNVALCAYGKDYFSLLRDRVQQGEAERAPVLMQGVAATAVRDAMHRQKFREHRSQFGSRYHDHLAAMGVKARDARLDRPEHCAHSVAPVGVSEVLSTANSSGTDVGDYKGHGVAGQNLRMKKRFFAEYGTLLGLCYVRPRVQLRRRVDKQFLVRDRDDFFQPELSMDTQVGVVARELHEGGSISDIFGYTGRDEWLRGARDTVAGGFDQNANSSQTWTTSRTFATIPSITGGAWRDVRPGDFANVFQETANTSYPRQFYLYTHNNLTAKRLVKRRPT